MTSEKKVLGIKPPFENDTYVVSTLKLGGIYQPYANHQT